MKKCCICKLLKEESEFHKRDVRCKKCKRKEVIDRRINVMRAYGGKCECCGETILEFLTIDHINGGGHQHRKKIGGRLYDWLIKNNFPKGEYQILCMNCNLAKGIFGKCPHQK